MDREVANPELLMELIARSPNLVSLQFSGDTGFGQTFFDRMAETVQLHRIPLAELEIFNCPLDFDFVLKLRGLEQLETSLKLPTELILKLVELPYLV